jgi:hypothetical protein
MQFWIRNVAFLFLIGSTRGSLGLLGSALYQVLAFLSFLVFAATFLPGLRFGRDVGFFQTIGAAFFVLAGVWLALSANFGSFHFYLVLTIAIALVTWRRDCQAGRQLATYVVALACVGVLAELVRILPFVWHFNVRVAAVLSWIGEKLANEDRNLGPTAMGLLLLIALITLALVREIGAERRHRYRWVIGVCLLALTHLVYLVVLKYYARWIANNHPAWEWLILNSQFLFLVLGTTVFTLYDRGRPMRSFAPTRVRRTAYASSAALVVGLAAAMTLGWAPPPTHKPARVMLYDAGYVNWDIPVHGVYGERSAGMFGMLPSVLEAVGFDVIASDDLTLLDRPDAPDCVVMINIQKYFEQQDRERIWQFVARGGGLLCLGDHTGVAGIRGPFNDLLEPVGIRFKFDSSTFSVRGGTTRWISASIR